MAQFTTTEVAVKFDTNTRTLRKFLRADAKANETTDALPGKGSRYMIEGKQLASLKSRFSKWQAVEADAKVARAEAKRDAAVEAAEVEETEDAD